MQAEGGLRPPEKPTDFPVSGTQLLACEKSLEEGEKGNNSLVLLSPKVRWPQNESGGECELPLVCNSSDFHFPINSIQLHPRTVELPSSLSPLTHPSARAHVHAFYTPCPAGVRLSFPVLTINSVKEERALLQYVLEKVLKRESGAQIDCPSHKDSRIPQDGKIFWSHE